MSVRSSTRPIRSLSFVLLGALMAVSCSSSDDPQADDGSGSDPAEEAALTDADDAVGGTAVRVESLEDLLPADTRGVFAVRTGDLLAGDAAVGVTALMTGAESGPLFAHVFAELGDLSTGVDLSIVADAMLVERIDVGVGRFVVGRTDESDLSRLAPGMATDATAIDPTTGWLVASDGDRRIALAPGGWFVVGSTAAVDTVLAAAAGDVGASPIELYLGALDARPAFRFAYGLPGLLADVEGDRSLRGAVAMTGALVIEGATIGGEIGIHTANATTFAGTYNRLDRHAIGAAEDAGEPVEVVDGLDGEHDQVIVTVPPSPLAPTAAEAALARNVFKKLFVGMDAHDYAEDVVDGGSPWFDLIVKSEADGDEPPSPASVFFRWEYKD
ncbi:MAG: hypothetical protein AAGA90_06255 [Actinomycetota bacterium]